MKKYGLVFFICLMAVACTEPIELVGIDREVVVECILDDGEQQILKLYWTMDDAQDNPDYIRDATAYLEDLTAGGEKLFFTSLNSGPYSLFYTPASGHRYKLTVLVDGFEPFTASTSFPHPAAMEFNEDAVLDPKIVYESTYDCGPSEYITHFRIIRGSTDPTWFIDSRVPGPGQEPPYMATTYPDVDLFNASGPFTKDLIDKDIIDRTGNWYNNFKADFYTLNYTTRGDYWKYFDYDAGKEISIVDLGGEDPMIHPNLTIAEEIAERFLQSHAHYKGIRTHLSDNFDNGQPIPSFSVAFLNYAEFPEMTGDLKYANRMLSVNQNRALKIFSVSEEYDRYLKEMLVEDSGDWKNMFDRKNSYSNIDGATGIFGAVAYCELIPVKEWFGNNWILHKRI